MFVYFKQIASWQSTDKLFCTKLCYKTVSTMVQRYQNNIRLNCNGTSFLKIYISGSIAICAISIRRLQRKIQWLISLHALCFDQSIAHNFRSVSPTADTGRLYFLQSCSVEVHGAAQMLEENADSVEKAIHLEFGLSNRRWFLFAVLQPLVMAVRPLYFCPVVSIYLSFSSPILSPRRLDIYYTSTHDVALVRIQNAGI